MKAPRDAVVVVGIIVLLFGVVLVSCCFPFFFSILNFVEETRRVLFLFWSWVWSKTTDDRLVNKSESRREGNHTDCRGKKSKKINFKAEKLSFRFVSERIFLITAHVLKRYQH
jgi:hypothetical protein